MKYSKILLGLFFFQQMVASQNPATVFSSQQNSYSISPSGAQVGVNSNGAYAITGNIMPNNLNTVTRGTKDIPVKFNLGSGNQNSNGNNFPNGKIQYSYQIDPSPSNNVISGNNVNDGLSYYSKPNSNGFGGRTTNASDSCSEMNSLRNRVTEYQTQFQQLNINPKLNQQAQALNDLNTKFQSMGTTLQKNKNNQDAANKQKQQAQRLDNIEKSLNSITDSLKILQATIAKIKV